MRVYGHKQKAPHDSEALLFIGIIEKVISRGPIVYVIYSY